MVLTSHCLYIIKKTHMCVQSAKTNDNGAQIAARFVGNGELSPLP